MNAREFSVQMTSNLDVKLSIGALGIGFFHWIIGLVGRYSITFC